MIDFGELKIWKLASSQRAGEEMRWSREACEYCSKFKLTISRSKLERYISQRSGLNHKCDSIPNV